MKLIVALGALIVVAGVALVLMMSRGGVDPTPGPAARAPAATTGAPAVTAGAPAAPALPPTAPSTASTGSDGVKEYTVGGFKIRDHRGGENKPIDLPPNPHPAESRELPSELTHDISQQIRRQMDACAAAVPKDARGDKPKLAGQLTVAIHDHKLTVTEMALQVRDVEGPSADALKQCVEEKSTSYVSSAPDQPDLDNYGIAITFAVP
ncbi:MAG: hypothetical protein ABI467_17225 [Kofleriaceae bacterium]